MGALELDACGREAERLGDHEVGGERADPARRDRGVEDQDRLDRVEDADFHQQQREQHVEDQPDDAAGVAVGQAGEEIGPGDGAGIGVGDVDLELADDDEQAGQ